VHNSTDRLIVREMEVVERTGSESDSSQQFLGKEFALLDRYKLADALVDTLMETKYRYRAASLLNCHRMFRGRTCRNGHKWARAAKSCGLRICPHCCRQRATEVAQKLEPFLRALPEKSSRFMVLTDVNCVDLSEGRALIFAAFECLRRSVEWKKKVRGCVVTFEATYNPHCVCGRRKRQHEGHDRVTKCKFRKAKKQLSPWHPHLNVLFEGEYFPHEQLCQMWKKATDGRAKVVYVSAVNNGFIALEEGGTSKAARELVKYITKASDLVGDGEAVEQFLDAVYNRRLYRTYGTFYRLNLEEEIEARVEVCPDCGSDEWVMTGLVNPQQIGMDLKGVLRDNRGRRELKCILRKAIAFAPKTPPEKSLMDAETFRRVRKVWDKNGLSFEERGEDWRKSIAWFETKRSDFDAASFRGN
jgi:hypothetical protein